VSLAPYGKLPIPRLTPDLLQLVKTGEVFSLAVDYQQGMLAPGVMATYSIAPHKRHTDPSGIAPATAAAEVITMSIHVGTHIDALCHIAEKQDKNSEVDPDGEPRLYAGDGKTVPAKDHATFDGQKHNSIEKMPPIVLRSVLLDVAGYKGVDVLPDAYAITSEDIQATAEKQGTTIGENTAVLVRTGYYQHLKNNNPVYRDAQAGLSLEAAKYLVEQGMILVGADNMGVEAMPPMDHSVHRFLLVHNGITHLENLNLDDLAEQGHYEFLLIVTPLKLTGATGSWVSPIAIT
jgi:kynurenine formamidase